MLARRGSIYYFRRSVPLKIAHIIGCREIWISLRTTSRTEALAKAGPIHAATREKFVEADKERQRLLDIIVQQQELIADRDAALEKVDDVIATLRLRMADASCPFPVMADGVLVVPPPCPTLDVSHSP